MPYLNQIDINGVIYNLENLTDGKNIVKLPELKGDDTFIVRGDVVDNLTSTIRYLPLSANQGRILNNKINDHMVDKNNPHSVTKAQVGLGNADNTSDMDKPVSTAQQKALDSHTKNKNNPHGVTAEQVGTYTKSEIDLLLGVEGSDVVGNITGHIANKNNPHNVTVEQIGADPAGSANSVQRNLNSHIENKDNPHGVTPDQIGAATATYVNSHVENKDNPHSVTAQQLGVVKRIFTATISTEWIGEEFPYTQTVHVQGITEYDVPFVDIIASDDLDLLEEEFEAYGLIYKITTAEDSITVYAMEPTETAVTIKMQVDYMPLVAS